MKTTIKYFCMVALLVAVATIAGCTKEENNDDSQTFTTSVTLPDSDSKALDGNGVKTFAVGDKIKLMYTQPLTGRVIEHTSLPLNALDISSNGKAARFSFVISGNLPQSGTQATFRYPATTPTQNQNGTLENLSAYDLAMGVKAFPGRNQLPSNIHLDNYCAILKLKFKNYAGTDITTMLTGVTVSVGSTNYTITPTGSTFASSPIYVAVLMANASSTQDITFSATGSNGINYTKTATSRTLQRGHLYPVEVTMTSPMCTYTAPRYSYALQYNKSLQNLIETSSGSVSNGEMYFRYDYVPFETTHPGITSSSTPWSTNRPKGENAGTYTVYYKVVPNSGYDGGVGETQLVGSININKANWTGIVTKTGTSDRTRGEYSANNSLTPVTADDISHVTYQWSYSWQGTQTVFWNLPQDASGFSWNYSSWLNNVAVWQVTYSADNNHNQTTIQSPWIL